MTQIKAEIIADSKNEFGNRLTTFVVTFPRFILAELNTHRMFSRNSASSRAIPFEKMVKSVEENPFIPIAWQKDHKGMQGNEYFDNPQSNDHVDKWLIARDKAVEIAKALNDSGVTKQLCNRLLEPFMWHTVIITASEYENFFGLRCPQYGNDEQGYYRSKKDALRGLQSKGVDISNLIKSTDLEWLIVNKGQAEIHMIALAEAMWDAYNESEPKLLFSGQWHIPFGDNLDYVQLRRQMGMIVSAEQHDQLMDKVSIKIATARCARVSYTVVGEEDKEPNYENDIKLHDRLIASGHLSPTEHCAKCMSEDEYHHNTILTNLKGAIVPQEHFGWSGNFRGFIQYRKLIE